MKAICTLFFLLVISLQARTWTDVNGRKIEAEMVRPDGDQVVVSMAGKEINIPRNKLSKEDIDFVDEWKPPELSLAGQLIVKGGKANMIERDYSSETIKSLEALKGKNSAKSPEESDRESNEPETKLKLAVAVPADFDPMKAPQVMIVCAPVNNEKERVAGNFRSFNTFAKSCADHGWVCITVDSNTGRPRNTSAAYQEAITLLEKEWRGMAKARYCTGGFSGGSKSCWAPAAWLIKRKNPVVGVFMAGCNHSFATIFRQHYKAPPEPYHNLKVFITNGTTDNIAPLSKVGDVAKDLKSAGIHNIRQEQFEGGHTVHPQHVDDALTWFNEAK